MLTLALLGRGDCQQTSGAFCASVACLWEWGVNDYHYIVLKELGGWADLNMVLRYAHLSSNHLQEYT